MDAYSYLIGVAFLILLSYFFEFVSKKIRLPSVVLLVLTGIGMRAVADHFFIEIPALSVILPVFGTLGLILIVLEGSLDLVVTRQKLGMIRQTFTVALASVLATTAAIVAGLVWGWGADIKSALLNALPFAVVSSAVAIPAARALDSEKREFVTYESSFSDIIGVLLFNVVLDTTVLNGAVIGGFLGNIVLMILISVALAVALTIYIDKIEHHVKFLPLLALLVLVYGGAKMMHFSPLILILILGLFLNNLELLPRVSIFQHLNYDKLDDEMAQFKNLIVELVFFIRTLFFLLFGFSVKAAYLFNADVLAMAGGLFLLIVALRWLVLVFTARDWLRPMLYFSPRGLITILLFLSIPAQFSIPALQNEVVVGTVLLTLFFLTFGNVLFERSTPKTASTP